jgi:hypothetical protein
MRKLIVIAGTLLLSACASVDRYDAAGDVHALLIAIRDNDQAGFDAHVDRPALKRQLETHLIGRARQAPEGLRALGALLAGPAADLVGEAFLRPSAFRAAATYYGYTPDKPIPGRVAIAGALLPAGDGKVCAKKSDDGPCLLTFALEAGVWKLVSVDDPSLLSAK